MRKLMLTILLAGGMAAFMPVAAQERHPEYLQAEKFTGSKLKNMLFSTKVDPHWFQKGNCFWFEYKTSEGTFWYVVDPVARTKKLLFDREKLAAQLTEIVQDPFEARQIPVRNLKAGEDGRTFTFEIVSSQDKKSDDKSKKDKKEKQVFYFSYDYPTQKLTHLTDKEKEADRKGWASVSPDGQTVVYAKDCNLYKMSIADYRKAQKDEKDSTIVEVQLTTDGTPDFGYGIPYSLLNTDTLCNGKRRYAWGAWSPDSKHFVTVVSDDRAVKPLWVINAVASPRPTLETYKYQMPGEMEAPVEHLYLFDMTTNSRKEIRTAAWKNQSLGLEFRPLEQKQRDSEFRPLVWQGDDRRFFLTRSSRDLHRIDVCTYTLGEDSIVPIVKERMNTYQETRPIHVFAGGKEFVQWSERDGWAHLYRENPYYEHLYRVKADGSGLKLLTRGDYFHEVEMDDEARFVVDNYSRVNTIPCAELTDSEGRRIMTIQESDFSQLKAAGYQFPEPFTVKAADGVTDLYGVMYKPFDFDSTKVYPIIDYVYPGPQVEAVNYPFTRMSVRTDRLAQAGFIVITVGQRGGHPSRSKWYHNYGYGNMRDYPLADHVAAVEQLAARYGYIDLTRVGIHGHSGGGFMSTAAILQYPDFYKAAVSCAGNHDNRIYNRWWSETHHGVREEMTEQGDTIFAYKIATNPEIAGQLKGHLMLVHGDIDNNVHPANTLRVVDALIRAGKRFDLLMLPGQRHGFGDMDEYFYWRMVDFFTDHLKGWHEKPVDIPRR